MNKAFRDTAGGIAIAIALLAAGYFLGTFHTHPLTKAADFPAWVQAIGSIVAIFAAIGISYTQQRNAIKRESRKVIDENLYTVKSIRDELAVLSEGFELQVGKEIRSLKRGDILLIEWNPAERPFVVYEACASQLGKIDDDRLRKTSSTHLLRLAAWSFLSEPTLASLSDWTLRKPAPLFQAMKGDNSPSTFARMGSRVTR